MTTAVIYVRVSSAEQLIGTSLQMQEDECRKFCETHEWQIAQVYREEGESAKTSARPRFIEMLNYLRKSPPDKLICYKFDRLARNTTDFHITRANLAALGCQLVSVTEPTTDDPAGRFLETILSAVAQLDNENRAQLSRSGMVARAMAGYWCHKAPLGYRLKRTPAGTTLEPDEHAGLMRQMFHGLADATLDAHSATELLNEALAPRKFELEDTRRLVEQEVYAGIVCSRLTKFQPVPAAWPPLAPTSVIDAARLTIANKRAYRSSPSGDWPLRGWLLCPTCNTPLTGGYSRGNGGRYGYYQCQQGHVRFKREQAHADFRQALKDTVQVCRPVLRLLRLVVKDVWEQEKLNETHTATQARLKADQASRREQRLIDAYLDGLVNEATFREKSRQLKEQRATARSTATQADLDSLDAEAVLDLADALFLDPDRLWINASAPDQLRLQVAFFGEHLIIEQDGSYRTSSKPSLATLCTTFPPPNPKMAPPRGQVLNWVGEVWRVVKNVAHLVEAA